MEDELSAERTMGRMQESEKSALLSDGVQDVRISSGRTLGMRL